MVAANKTDAYQQALELVTQLHGVNKYDLDEDTAEWLASESEIKTEESGGMSKKTVGIIYEGIFEAIQSMREIGPESLWDRAQENARREIAMQQADQEKEKVPIIHRRLLRLYWMVRLAAEDLIEQKPRARLGKILIKIEHDLREAFVETKEGVKLPLAMRRRKQWGLLADYGMGLTVDQIYDLRPPRFVIAWNTGEKLWVGLIIGAVIGFLFALAVIGPQTP
ncbi:hypothetical protein ACFLQW_02865 [Candidatus Zixiibacteriota bacterium]